MRFVFIKSVLSEFHAHQGRCWVSVTFIKGVLGEFRSHQERFVFIEGVFERVSGSSRLCSGELHVHKGRFG